jgi:hypothetical protein
MTRSRILACTAFLVTMIAASCASAARNPVPAPGECVTDEQGNSICPPDNTTCMPDADGKVFCSPPKGSIVQDNYGNAVCGPGPCVPDRYGQFYCAPGSGGAIFVNDDGKVECKDGCVEAAKSLCITPDALK